MSVNSKFQRKNELKWFVLLLYQVNVFPKNKIKLGTTLHSVSYYKYIEIVEHWKGEIQVKDLN